jgi:hypothetical protein
MTYYDSHDHEYYDMDDFISQMPPPHWEKNKEKWHLRKTRIDKSLEDAIVIMKTWTNLNQRSRAILDKPISSMTVEDREDVWAMYMYGGMTGLGEAFCVAGEPSHDSKIELDNQVDSCNDLPLFDGEVDCILAATIQIMAHIILSEYPITESERIFLNKAVSSKLTENEKAKVRNIHKKYYKK